MSNPISAQAYQSTSAMDVEMAQEEGMNVGNVQEVTGMKRGWSETDNPGPTEDFKRTCMDSFIHNQGPAFLEQQSRLHNVQVMNGPSTAVSEATAETHSNITVVYSSMAAHVVSFDPRQELRVAPSPEEVLRLNAEECGQLMD